MTLKDDMKIIKSELKLTISEWESWERIEKAIDNYEKSDKHMTGGMRSEIEKIAIHDVGIKNYLTLQKKFGWTDLEMLYQALLFQSQSLKHYKDEYDSLFINGPPPQYIITTQENIDNIKKEFKQEFMGDFHPSLTETKGIGFDPKKEPIIHSVKKGENK